MQGSFVRRGVQARRDPGTRSGLHGQTLISSGLADLDAVLEGGMPLGSVVLLLEDPHSQQHLNIIKYFIAEGLACGQKVQWLLPHEPAGGAARFLPAPVDPAAMAAAAAGAAGQLGEEEDEEDGEGGSGGAQQTELRIAWQYRKYLQVKEEQQQEAALQQRRLQQQQRQQSHRAASSSSAGGTQGGSGGPSHRTQPPAAARAGASRAWAHVFDLRKGMGAEALGRSGLGVSTPAGPHCWQHIQDQACSFISQFTQPEPPGPGVRGGLPAPHLLKGPEGVGRLVLQSLASPAWGWACRQDAELHTALLRCVLAVRQVARDARCAALLTCPTGMLPRGTALRLQHLCDVVLLLQSVSDASQVVQLLPDPASAAALLAVGRLPAVGVPRLPHPHLHVVRHRRKAIAIQMVDVDPDAEAALADAGGGAVAGGGSAPAAAVLCAGPPAAKKVLDF